MINPFPNKPWFLRVCCRSLLKTLGEKEKLLVTSNFSFSHSVFYLLEELSAIFIKSKIVVSQSFEFGRVKNLSFGKGLRQSVPIISLMGTKNLSMCQHREYHHPPAWSNYPLFYIDRLLCFRPFSISSQCNYPKLFLEFLSPVLHTIFFEIYGLLFHIATYKTMISPKKGLNPVTIPIINFQKEIGKTRNWAQ